MKFSADRPLWTSKASCFPCLGLQLRTQIRPGIQYRVQGRERFPSRCGRVDQSLALKTQFRKLNAFMERIFAFDLASSVVNILVDLQEWRSNFWHDGAEI